MIVPTLCTSISFFLFGLDMDSDSWSRHAVTVNLKKNENATTTTTRNDDNISQDIQEFIEDQRPETTKKKTDYDIGIWKKFCSSNNENREIEEIPAVEMNVLLCRFFMNVKKKNGGEYEPSSLTSIHRSIQRYLNNKNSPLNLFKDQEFNKSREVLVAKKRQLVEIHAKGNRPQAARIMTEAEEDLLFEKGQFGDHNPEVLQRTIWWAFSLHFGFRARDESRKLKWGDVSLDKDPETGTEILVWRAERGSKTRHGDGHQRAFSPTAHPTNNERCPVKLYKAFASHRPEAMKKPDSPFFLAVNHKRKEGSGIWYSNSPLGKNSIGKFLVSAAQAVGLPGNVSNHSIRKTCISRLMDAGIPENYVAQLSGHKNLKSLDAYKSASTSHQRQMSMVLSRSSTSNATNTQSTSSTQAMSTTSLSVQGEEDVIKSACGGVFSSATIGKFEGCTFNFNLITDSKRVDENSSEAKRKRIDESVQDTD
ncbi:hypothetical protein QZH41_002174 [Actinostola sp. cb2023]|nr:hypothetical protein QZH41_002174 [Actinostola sp. cb2023]